MDWITIYDEPQRVRAENGTVYSTNPGETQATNGRHYILKGPQPEVVAAEALGYTLAGTVGLAVPPFALCRHPKDDAVFFASQVMPVRSGIEVMIETSRVDNPEILGDCFAFDVWVANVDRNDGSFVGDVTEPSAPRIRAYSIDFEQCLLLRGVSAIMVNALENRKLKTPHALPARCFRGPFPSAMCRRIATLTAADIDGAFADVAATLPTDSIPWQPTASSFLFARAQRIESIAREVWNA